jgi:hypothetical protein
LLMYNNFGQLMLVENKLKFIFQLLIKPQNSKSNIQYTSQFKTLTIQISFFQNPNNPYILSKINSIDIIINTNTKSKYIIQLIIEKTTILKFKHTLQNSKP